MNAELAEGLKELIATDVAESFTYRGTSFSALIQDESSPGPYDRDYRAGERFDSVLVVDPSASAFKRDSDGDQLPSKGENLTHSGGRKYAVSGVEFYDGGHVAFINCRKGARPAIAQLLHQDGSPIQHEDGSLVEPEAND